MDGLASVQMRIADLRAQLGITAVRPTSSSTSAGTTTATGTTTTTTFDDVLAAQTAAPATGSGSLTPASRLPAGQYGTLQPPSELVGFGNGRIPTSSLASIGVGDHTLYAPAANAFTRMAADAKAAGVTLGVNDSYRDLAGQQRLADELGLYSQGGKAAAPGTSTHGWGLSLDLQLDGKAQQWMRDNGYKYGFAEDVPREPWHWTYRPAS